MVLAVTELGLQRGVSIQLSEQSGVTARSVVVLKAFNRLFQSRDSCFVRGCIKLRDSLRHGWSTGGEILVSGLLQHLLADSDTHRP